MVECKKRDRETLEKIIFDNVALGSRILTDGWRAYQHLGNIFRCAATLQGSRCFCLDVCLSLKCP